MKPRILSLCSGYGGLDMAIEEFFGAETAAFVEYEAAPSKVLAHHWPDVPNLGDMTKVDWATLSDIDIIAGGTPCQDLSAAGKRAGMTEGTRSNLWVQMREAVAVLRPSLVVWENVRGAYSARADSEMEREPGLLGDGAGGPALRALGRVLGDLASLGYDAEWVGVRASDAGAPHARFRVFVLAYADGARLTRFGRIESVERDADRRRGANRARFEGQPASSADSASVEGGFGDGDDVCPRCGAVGRRQAAGRGAAEDSDVTAGGERWFSASGQAEGGRSRADSGRRGGAPSTDAAVFGSERGGSGRTPGASPAAVDPSPDSAGRGCDGRAQDTLGKPFERTAPTGGGGSALEWGPYAPAVERWERESGRVAPAPTNADGRNGGHRLSAQFVEWMMGLPAGHVTATEIGISRNEQLKALGNGVVPQQAHLALSLMWPRVLKQLAVAS